MKITDVKTYLLKVPIGNKKFFSSQCVFPERNSLLVSIETNNGINGWGEAGQYGPGEPVSTFVDIVLKPSLIGKNPLDTTVIWEDLFNSMQDFGRKTTGMEALSGINIALWDIVGKFYGKPIYELLGGSFRKKVLAYSTGFYYRGEDISNLKKSLQLIKEEATDYLDEGFKALKGKIGLLHIEEDAERVAAIRDAAGKNIVLMIDANHAYNFHNAKRIGKFLEQADVLFFEEPVSPEDLNGFKMLREALNIAIATGENEFNRFDFMRLLKNDCVDIIQPDIGCAGGFTELKRIEALASASHVQVIPHVWGSGVALAASLQFCSTLAPSPQTAFPRAPENEPMIEYDKNFNPLRDELLTEPFKIEGGFLEVPNGPGLGIEVNMTILEKYLAKSNVVYEK
jgi:D-galactarolactone cycloisomerase